MPGIRARINTSEHVNARQPDILLVMPDQMRGDSLSILDHAVVCTPTMDRLAAQGTLFSRAYTPVASCIPARYALLTGLSAHKSGVVGFAAKPFETPSLPKLLTEAGYATIIVGRNMHQVLESGNCGYQTQILGSTYVDDDAYDRFLRKAAPETGGIKNFVDKLRLDYNYWQSTPWPLADELHPTEWTVAESRKAIRETDAEQPLFLTTSFYAPHPPLFAPAEYFDAYMKKTLPTPAHGDWVDWDSLSPTTLQRQTRISLEGETLRRSQAGYYGLIEHIDEQISGLIRDFEIRSEKAGRPWVIVVTSDHGEMLGDHGYFRKCEPYEGSANIPFIVAGSADLRLQAGQTLNRPVSLHDIMPTLLELAGREIPEHLDGVNLVPALQGRDREIRPWLHYEHARCYSDEQAFHALTDGAYKYIWRPHDGREHLFNIEDDIREEEDLATAQPERLATWRRRLAERLSGRPEGFVKDGNLVPGRPYKPLNAGMWGVSANCERANRRTRP